MESWAYATVIPDRSGLRRIVPRFSASVTILSALSTDALPDSYVVSEMSMIDRRRQ